MSAIPARMSRAAEGSIEALRSSSSRSCAVQHRLGEAERACSPEESTPALVRRYLARSSVFKSSRSARRDWRPRRSCRRREGFARPSDCPEAARKRRRNSSPPAPHCGRGGGRRPDFVCPDVGSRNAKDHVDRRRLAAPFGPRSPTISPWETRNDTSSTALRPPKVFARRSTRRAGGVGSDIGRSYQSWGSRQGEADGLVVVGGSKPNRSASARDCFEESCGTKRRPNRMTAIANRRHSPSGAKIRLEQSESLALIMPPSGQGPRASATPRRFERLTP